MLKQVIARRPILRSGLIKVFNYLEYFMSIPVEYRILLVILSLMSVFYMYMTFSYIPRYLNGGY